MLPDALVTRVIFAKDSEGIDLTAVGVEFIHEGEKYVVNAGKEVIISAG